MGSLINNNKNAINITSHGYSKGKQRNWHYVGNGESRPLPYGIGVAESVVASKYASINDKNFIIP